MSTASMVHEVNRLIDLLSKGHPVALGAIPWASPVVAFGDPARSIVATLGLNPSNLEFVDGDGNQLQAPHNRFESLDSLRVNDWGQVATRGVQRIWEACEDYFYRNPYDQWFMRLEKLLVGTGASYYTQIGDRACHLDLVPFATAEKWSAMSTGQQAELIKLGIPSLVQAIRASSIRVLVLNGSSVVKEFDRLLDKELLERYAMPEWDLQAGRVSGQAYVGRISRLGGISLGREILVLGYNHNIQSSFGVTREVVSRMGAWIAGASKEALA